MEERIILIQKIYTWRSHAHGVELIFWYNDTLMFFCSLKPNNNEYISSEDSSLCLLMYPDDNVMLLWSFKPDMEDVNAPLKPKFDKSV